MMRIAPEVGSTSRLRAVEMRVDGAECRSSAPMTLRTGGVRQPQKQRPAAATPPISSSTAIERNGRAVNGEAGGEGQHVSEQIVDKVGEALPTHASTARRAGGLGTSRRRAGMAASRPWCRDLMVCLRRLGFELRFGVATILAAGTTCCRARLFSILNKEMTPTVIAGS